MNVCRKTGNVVFGYSDDRAVEDAVRKLLVDDGLDFDVDYSGDILRLADDVVDIADIVFPNDDFEFEQYYDEFMWCINDKVDKVLFARRAKVAENYDASAPIRLWVGNLGKYNEGELVGEWISLPCTDDEWDETLERIGIGSRDEFGQPYEEWFFADHETDIPGLKIGEYSDFDELNSTAEEWEALDDYQQAAVGIRMDMLGEDFLDAIDGADDVRIWHGCIDMTDVAYMYIDETGGAEELSKDELEKYFDYAAYGRDLENDGNFDYSEELGCMVECY